MRMRWYVAILLVSVASHLAASQAIPVPTAQFESRSASTRRQAFYSVMSLAAGAQPAAGRNDGARASLVARASQQADLGLALIRLLQRENALLAKAWPSPPADFEGQDYYPDLVLTVADLHDRRAVSALIPAVSLGDRVAAGLAALGDTAVPGLVQALRDRDWKTRDGAVRALGKITARRSELHLTDASLTMMTQALLQVAEDKTSHSREPAIAALVPISGSEIRAVMARLANDTTQTRQEPNGPSSYPIRDAARGWLRAHPF